MAVRRGGFIGLMYCLCTAWSITQSGSDYYDESSLVCGEESLEYTIPQVLRSNVSVQVVVKDHEGQMKPVMSDSSCGLWVTLDSDGFLIIDVEYDGCFVKRMGNFYTMTMLMLHNITGEWEVYQEEDLRCPVFQVMDAPALNKCSGVPRANRIPCAGPVTSQDICLQKGCCYDQSDSNSCYYGDKVTAQCTRDGQMLVAISKDVTLPPLILDSIKFLRGDGSDCKPVHQNDAFILFQISSSTCGTTQKMESGNLIYENDLIAEKDIQTWRRGFITRDSSFRLHIHCSYTASASDPLHVEVYTLPPPPPVSSTGPLSLEMRIAKDSQYGLFYATGDYPVIKYLRDPVFAEVHILNRKDPALILVLEHCWATPSENPSRQPQWPILVNRCPFSGDHYRTQLVSIDQNQAIDFPSHYKRFILSTFTFVDGGSEEALGGLVYLHCSASACIPSSMDSCMTTCNSRKRATNMASSPILVSSEGPIDFCQNDMELAIQGGTPGVISSWQWALMEAFGFSFSAGLVGLLGWSMYLCRKNKLSSKNTETV